MFLPLLFFVRGLHEISIKILMCASFLGCPFKKYGIYVLDGEKRSGQT